MSNNSNKGMSDKRFLKFGFTRSVYERFQVLIPLLFLLILSFILSLSSPYFLTLSNLKNILLQSSLNIILAIGITFVIISGGIDLSIGSVLGLTGVITALLFRRGIFWPLGVLLGLLSAIIIGLTNGLLISKGKLPPFIATLGMLGIARSIALILTEARPIFGMPIGFINMFSGVLISVPTPVIIAVILSLVSHFCLSTTPFGKYTYAIGGNEEVCIRLGIKVNTIKIKLYILCSIFAAIGGFIQTARLNAADPNAGLQYELDAIAAAVLGGASLSGGEGSIPGTIIGALIMGVIRNGLNLLNVQAYYQQLVIGLVIIGSVLIDSLRKH